MTLYKGFKIYRNGDHWFIEGCDEDGWLTLKGAQRWIDRNL